MGFSSNFLFSIWYECTYKSFFIPYMHPFFFLFQFRVNAKNRKFIINFLFKTQKKKNMKEMNNWTTSLTFSIYGKGETDDLQRKKKKRARIKNLKKKKKKIPVKSLTWVLFQCVACTLDYVYIHSLGQLLFPSNGKDKGSYMGMAILLVKTRPRRDPPRLGQEWRQFQGLG